MKRRFKLCKLLLNKVCYEDDSYTIMLVPDDGTDIKKKSIDSKQLKKWLFAGASVMGIFLICLCTMSVVIYTGIREHRELAEFRIVKHQQAQKLEEIETMAKDIQKNMAALNALESQLRVQMEKSGIEVPAKEKRDSEHDAKGGPSKTTLKPMDIVSKQNETLIAEQNYTSCNLNKLLAAMKKENYKRDVTPDLWPLAGGYVTSEFGNRNNPFDNSSNDYHPGIDIAANYGTPIYATASGSVIQAGWYGGYGKYILLEHDYGYSTAFGHLSAIEVSTGDYVTKGQVIGYVGSTGYSTGPHLHYEIKQYGVELNPRKLMK